MKKWVAAVFLIILFVPMLVAFSSGVENWPQISLDEIASGAAGETLESFMKTQFPFANTLKKKTAQFQTLLGRDSENGCFYSEAGIIQNLPAADEETTRQNIEALLLLAEKQPSHSCFLLVPTAAAIKQNDIPSFALESLFNQKKYIEDCYKSFNEGGYRRTADVYSNLFSHQDEYLYYRTDPSLTIYGNYYVYQSLGERLGFRAKSMNAYNISHLRHQYEGALTRLVPYSGTAPDTVSVFVAQKQGRAISVIKNPHSAATVSETVFDQSALYSEHPQNVYFGEDWTILDIVVQESLYDDELLIYTDGSILPAIALLSAHYKTIRIIHTARADEQEYAQTLTGHYYQTLFAFSVQTFGFEPVLQISWTPEQP